MALLWFLTSPAAIYVERERDSVQPYQSEARVKEAIRVVPGLVVILVNDRKDSATFVSNKKKACESVGSNSFEVHLPADSKEEVLKFVSWFKR